MGGRYPKVSQYSRRNHSLQPHSRPALDVNGQATDRLSIEYPFSVIVPESIHRAIHNNEAH